MMLPLDLSRLTYSCKLRRFSLSMQYSSYVKRKVALVVAYVGSNYFGLQMDPNQYEKLNTIEYQLSKALKKIGCIKEGNHIDLSKIQWSRSSRTDKGVHASKLSISAKLEINLDWINSTTLKLDELVKQVNLELPSDIRVISCIKTNQGFRARDACNWREYEYILPVKVISSSSDTNVINSKVNMLNSILKKFEGAHSFHNFHRLSRNDLLSSKKESRTKTNQGNMVQHSVVNNEDNYVDTMSDDTLDNARLDTKPDEEATYNDFIYHKWAPITREICARTRGIVFSSEVLEIITDSNTGSQYIKIRIRGQSFLLHQIRIMIGAAVLVANNIIPEYVIDLALFHENQLFFPKAPSEGLMLVNSGFAHNSNGKSYYYSAEFSGSLMPNEENVLLSVKENDESNNFKNCIYERIMRDWSSNNDEILHYFNKTLLKYAVPNHLNDEWRSIYNLMCTKKLIDDSNNRIKESSRIEREIALFNRLIENNDKNMKSFPHKKFLPNKLTTHIILKYRFLPGDIISEGLRALALKVIRKEIRHDLTCDELVNLIDATGGIKYYAENFPKHKLIE